MNYQVIILAAGNGTRSQLNYHKIFYMIKNQPLIAHTLQHFLEDFECKKIVLVIQKEDEAQLKEIISSDKVCYIYGGKTRQESVCNGLQAIDSTYVLIHDGARPFLSVTLINRIKKALISHRCVIPVIPLKDSIKKVENNRVIQTVDRSQYRLIQCPQGFITEDIKKAHSLAKHQNYTDDSAMIEELLKQEVYCVEGEISNKKMTYFEDFR